VPNLRRAAFHRHFGHAFGDFNLQSREFPAFPGEVPWRTKARTALPPPAADVTLARVSIGQSSQGPRVVWGGYGYGNTGDDLVLAVALVDLRRQPGTALQVLSPSPDQTRLYLRDTEIILHPSGRPRRAFEKWFWRWTDYIENAGMMPLADGLYRAVLKHPDRFTSEPNWVKALAAASSLHLTGGGYLTDRFDVRNFLRPLRLARSRRLPVTTSPLGLGPFRNHGKAVAVAEALRGAQLAVRDEDSLRFCQTHGLDAVEKPDDGFRWRQVVDLPVGPAPHACKTIGVCIYAQHSSQWSAQVETWWVNCLQTLTRTASACQIEGFCFHTGREMDYEITRRLFAQAGLNPDSVRPPESDFRTAIVKLSNYSAVLSTRFHAVVTASEMQIPCVAAVLDDYYETKMRGALKYASAPLRLVNPLHDPPEAAAPWLTTKLGL
jgi:polysaccharide pyruvyl transferase WcaK-like protein